MATQRKPAAKPRIKVSEGSTGDAPSVMSLKSDPDRKVEWADCFEIDGTMYQHRTSATPNMALMFFRIYRQQGANAAQDYLLDSMLSPGAYDALLGFEDLTAAHVTQVIDIVYPIMMGEKEEVADPN